MKRGITAALLVACGMGLTAKAAEVSIPIPPGATYTAKRLHDPERLYIDIEGEWENQKGRVAAPAGDGLVKGIRSAMRSPEVKRVVLDLNEPAGFIAVRMTNPERLVLKLRAETVAPVPAVAEKPVEPAVVAAAVPEPAPTAAPAEPQATAAEQEAAASEDAGEKAEEKAEEKPEEQRVEPAVATPVLKTEPAPEVPAAPAAAEPPVYAIRTVPEGPRKLVVLQGLNGFNNISTKTAIEPVVEVRDDRDLPVAGAEVLFELPRTGASAFFPDKSLQLRTRTNDQGQAAGTGMLPNHIPGRFEIRVTSGSQQQAGLFIPQRNVIDDKEAARIHVSPWRRKRTWIGLGASAGLSLGLILATRGGSPAAGTGNSLSITPGPVNIGGLR